MVHQSGMCQSDVLSTVLSGIYYNHCWALHEAYTEAIERFFLQKYFPFEVLEEPQNARSTHFDHFEQSN